jgi:hypothetical protein
MTTIVYKDGVVAFDTRFTNANGVITTDKGKKFLRLILTKGVMVFSGALVDAKYFRDNLVHPTEPIKYESPYESVSGLLVFDNTLYSMMHHDNWLLFEPMFNINHSGVHDCVRAYGSGRDWALAAMDFGCSPREAVRYAMTRDVYTGGDVVQLVLPSLEFETYTE